MIQKNSKNNPIKQNLEITNPLRQDGNTRSFHLGLLLISCLSLVSDKQYQFTDWFTYMKDECCNMRAEYFRVLGWQKLRIPQGHEVGGK